MPPKAAKRFLDLLPRAGRVPTPTVGIYAFVDYGVAAEPWHERYVAGVLDGQKCVCVTPDLDIVEKVLDVPPFRQVFMGTEAHTLPAMLGRPKGHPVYRFDRGLSAAELRGLQPDIDEAMGVPEEGAASEDEEEEEEEVDPPPVPRPARKIPVKTKADERFSGGGRWPPSPAGKGVWLLAEGPDIGKEVDLVAGVMVCLGRRGLYTAATEVLEICWIPLAELPEHSKKVKADAGTPAKKPDDGAGGSGLVALKAALKAADGADGDDDGSGDARILPIKRDEESGERWRDFRSVAQTSHMQEFADWPLDGPRTALWLCKEIAKSGGGPVQHHTRWRTAYRVEEADRACHEHEFLCTLLEVAGSYDQLDLGCLASMETVCRRLQLLEETKAGGGMAAFEGAKHFLGYRRTGPLLAPSLSNHVSSQLSQQVSIMKEMRKHADEKKLSRDKPGKGPGKGATGDGG